MQGFCHDSVIWDLFAFSELAEPKLFSIRYRLMSSSFGSNVGTDGPQVGARGFYVKSTKTCIWLGSLWKNKEPQDKVK